MKKLFIGLLALVSISSYASDYEYTDCEIVACNNYISVWDNLLPCFDLKGFEVLDSGRVSKVKSQIKRTFVLYDFQNANASTTTYKRADKMSDRVHAKHAKLVKKAELMCERFETYYKI